MVERYLTVWFAHSGDPLACSRWRAPSIDEVARHPPNSRHLVPHHLAHVPVGLLGLSQAECLYNLIAHFIDRRDTVEFDLRCLDELRPPPFMLAEDEAPGP